MLREKNCGGEWGEKIRFLYAPCPTCHFPAHTDKAGDGCLFRGHVSRAIPLSPLLSSQRAARLPGISLAAPAMPP